MSKRFKISLLIALSIGLRPAFAQQINKQLAAELASIYNEDQRYRVAAIAAAKKFGAGSAQDNELMKRQDAADLANLVKVEAIIARYGYPGRSLVGAQRNVVFTVVQHNDQQTQEKYLPLFIKAAEKGELERSLLPLMIDRVRTGKGQAQLYGTQLFESKGKAIQIFPIEDEVNVDVRRKAAGLPPLADYYQTYGITYTVPTAAGNLNPKALYFNKEEQVPSPVEAIGGDEGIKARLVYPAKAKAAQITGFVTVGFTVTKDGQTKAIEVVKGLGYDCDEEAIRVIRETKYLNQTGEDRELRMKLPFPAKN